MILALVVLIVGAALPSVASDNNTTTNERIEEVLYKRLLECYGSVIQDNTDKCRMVDFNNNNKVNGQDLVFLQKMVFVQCYGVRVEDHPFCAVVDFDDSKIVDYQDLRKLGAEPIFRVPEFKSEQRADIDGGDRVDSSLH